MSKKDSSMDLVGKLIAQDVGVSEFEFEEFRMNLEESLRLLDRRARSVRWASFIAVGVAIACQFAILPLEMFRLTQVPWVRPLWGACFFIAVVTAGALAILYRHKYRPLLDRGRVDLQLAMIRDLQQQVAQLSERIGKQANP